MRYFNTEGRCKPEEHYMVCLDDRLREIKERFVDRKKYFVINKGRQYGKTTTLMALAEYLKKDYIVIFLDFQLMSAANFADEQTFSRKFIGQVERYFSRKQERMEGIDQEAFQALLSLKNGEKLSVDVLFDGLSRVCETAKKPIVLMVDEVDSASNNQVFLDFLAQLRGYYLNRDELPTFHSVILAGVYDIKNLKLKIRPESEHQYNSPWNIAANFDLDMDFSAGQIAGMLQEYEADHITGMNVEEVAGEIYQYTSGYPYLISLICKMIDETLQNVESYSGGQGVWSKAGVAEAVKMILKLKTPLFDSMVKQLSIYPELREGLEDILYRGKRILFSPAEKYINLGVMFGYLKEESGRAMVANRIFEMYLTDLFMSEESKTSDIYCFGQNNQPQFIKENRLDMDLVLEKFVEYFTDIYGDNDEKFVEAYGRKFFLLYLKPIINGTGNYYLEAQTRDASRTDVIVDYMGEQFVVELKIWRGNEYNERGEQQLAGYLDYYHLDRGYMLSFCFNKKKETGMRELRVGDKTIVEAVV